MVDERLLRRIDVLLALVAGWFVLSLVVACFALMVFDLALGMVALATVVLTLVVGGLSYARSTGIDPDVRVEVR
ncbi:hypothetical protein ACFQJC_05380 [Haloferax namakaokahaiae]|uniref:Uncharacterized protein n=1 Tax=Haloferax namakaokahaiae TaxID=1748331 RepID=A0ABD5ZCM1_9EURY